MSFNRIWTHDLPNTRRTLYPLSYKNLWRASSFNCKNSVKWPGSPIGTQVFSRSHACVTLFHIYLPSCNFTIIHLSLFITYSLLNPAGGRRRMSCKNSVKWPGSPWVLVAQWIERPPGVRKVMGSNPIGTQIFSRSHARVTLLSYIYLPSCNFTITHLSLFITYSLLSPAGGRRRMSCENSVMSYEFS